MSEFTSLIGLASTLLVGGVLLYAGAGKLRARRRFVAALESYRFLPAASRAPLSVLIPAAEVALGGLLLTGAWQAYAAAAAALLLVVFSAGVAVAFSAAGKADCGCLGRAGEQLPTSLVLGRNFSLVVLALVAVAAGGPSAWPDPGWIALAFGAASLALAVSLLAMVHRESPGPQPGPVSDERRRFLRLAASAVTGLVAAASLGVLERRTAEAACFGCGTCGTDYVFLYCSIPCCAVYWVRPYNYCETSCPSCSPRYQTFCGISSCC